MEIGIDFESRKEKDLQSGELTLAGRVPQRVRAGVCDSPEAERLVAQGTIWGDFATFSIPARNPFEGSPDIL